MYVQYYSTLEASGKFQASVLATEIYIVKYFTGPIIYSKLE